MEYGIQEIMIRRFSPKKFFSFPKVWEMKANFEFEENWDVNAIPVDKQKLDEIKKQKTGRD